MKNYLILIAIFCGLQTTAQPDIKKSIYVAQKNCWTAYPIQGGNIHFAKITSQPGAGFFSVLGDYNARTSNSQEDIRLFRIDGVSYDTIWSKVYGGSNNESHLQYQLKALPNGHILVAGTTKSFDLDFASNPVQAGVGVFFMEVDTAGNIVRTKILNSNSGFSGTTLRDVIVDGQGNIYATGDTWNDNMDFAHVANGKDGYLVKLDTAFNKEWIRFWIGYDSDQPGGLGFINNGNIAVAGITGDTGTIAMLGHLDKGKGDLYIEAYSPQGTTLWNARYGGKEYESGHKVVYDSTNSEIFVVGETYSANGDIGFHTALAHPTDTNRLENGNLWVLKLDTLGNLIHSKNYGSSRNINISFPQPTKYEDAIWHNGDLWVALKTTDGGGDFGSQYYAGDLNMIATFDNKANLTSKLIFIDSSNKTVSGFVKKVDTLFVAGFSEYSSIVTESAFRCNTSVAKSSVLFRLMGAPLAINEIEKEEGDSVFELYPNPSHSHFYIKNDIKENYIITLYDLAGKQLLQKTKQEAQLGISVSHLSSGTYIYHVKTGVSVEFGKLMIIK